MRSIARIPALFALVALAASGCDRMFQKDTERTIAEADKKSAAGEYRVAIKLYEASLDGTARTAEVHYKLAMIYDDKLHEPLDALHHFARYLELAPSGPHAADAKKFQKDGALRAAESVNKGALMTQQEAVQLKKENLDLRMKIVAMKAAKATPVPGPPGKGDAVQKPVPEGARTYVVQPGDTFASIAAKVYKNKGAWMKIRDANFSGGKGTPTIKAGQTLVIP